MLDPDLWTQPPSLPQVAGAMGEMLAFIEPTVDADRATALARMLIRRGYTAAEIELIRQEAPFANHYGERVRLDVLEAIVQRSRHLRAMLERPITGDEMVELLGEHSEINHRDFGVVGYDHRNRQMYRYAPEVMRERDHVPEATPELDEPTVHRLRSAETGLHKAADLMESSTPKP